MSLWVVLCSALHWTSFVRLVTSASGALALALLPGCGSSDSTRVVQETPPNDVPFDTGVKVCPSFIYTMVLPQAIRPGEVATVMAFATDPRWNDNELKYLWSATSGGFDRPDASLSQYTCADSGPQVLSVTTSDPEGCENNLDFDVICGAP